MEEREGVPKWQFTTAKTVPLEGGSFAYASGTKPDATALQIKGNWIEMLKHEGKEWKIRNCSPS
jgi:hypothetical protein